MLIYHYTDVHGLLGILQNKSIWASQLGQMNDKKEGLVANDLLKEYLKSEHLAQKINSDLSVAMVGDFCSTILENFEISSTYVFSLSEQPDLLSQWRGYAPNGGYCIGFEKSAIEHMAKTNGFSLGKCSYNPAENQRVIQEALDDYLIDEVDWSSIDLSLIGTDRAKSIVDMAKNIGSDVWRKVEGKSALMKHISFEEEAEWRVYGLQLSKSDIKYRAGAPYIKPYYEFDLKPMITDFSDHIVKEIIISPGLDEQKATAPLRQMIEHSDMGQIEIRHSCSPFRH